MLLLAACNNNTSVSEPKKIEENTLSDTKTNIPPVVKEQVYNLDSVRQKILKDNLKSNHSDTLTYEFSLEGDYSLEGAGGTAYYHNRKLVKIEIGFYRETGKNLYNYVMKDNKWKVERIIYDYLVPLFEVKNDKDMVIRERIKFQSDLEGNVIGKFAKESKTDYYLEMKKIIPFDL